MPKTWIKADGTVRYLPEPYEVLDRPLWYHTQGLSQTATGYGSKLTSSRCVKLPNGQIRRIYISCYSNIGTAWIVLNGELHVVRD